MTRQPAARSFAMSHQPQQAAYANQRKGRYMQRNMLRRALYCALVGGLTAGLAACGGGGDSAAATTPPTSMGTMPVLISDASADDWAIIGVRVLAIALVPQGGGDNVTVWTAPTPAPLINLEQLDQLGEILGNASVPTGTYSGCGAHRERQPGRRAADGIGQSRGRLPAHRRHHGAVRPDPDPGQGRAAGQPHGGRQGGLRQPAHRQHRGQQCAGPGVRPEPPGLHRRPYAAGGRRRHAVGRRLQGAGAPPPGARHRRAGAAAPVRHCRQRRRRQCLAHHDARVPGAAGHQSRRPPWPARRRCRSRPTPPTARSSTTSMPRPAASSRTSPPRRWRCPASRCASRRATRRMARWWRYASGPAASSARCG